MPDPEPQQQQTQPTPEPGNPSSTPTSTPDQDPDPTLLAGGGGDGDDPEVDWRVAMLGKDHEGLEQLNRFKSGQDFFKSFSEAQATIRSGAHKNQVELGENPTDEELATWRQENGIPGEAKGYLENLPDGLVLGEEDEAMVGSFLDSAHGMNMKPETVHAMLNWYTNDLIPQQEAAQAEADKVNRAAAVEELRGKWGGDYKSNLDAGLNFLNSTAPTTEDGTSGAELILGARLADGSLAGDNPVFLEWLASVANEANPAGFVAPGSGLTQEQSIENEIGEIERLMRENPQAYYADDAKQARLRTLYDAKAKFAKAS